MSTNRNINVIHQKGSGEIIEFAAAAALKTGLFLTFAKGNPNNAGSVNVASAGIPYVVISLENYLTDVPKGPDGANSSYKQNDIVRCLLASRGDKVNVRFATGTTVSRGDLIAVGDNGLAVITTTAASVVAVADETFTTSAVANDDVETYGNEFVSVIIL